MASRKDKNQQQQIQVFVRVRPTNQTELNAKSFHAIEIPSQRDVIVHERQQDKVTKKFTYDRVFGPESKQIDVYNCVAAPLVKEVLAGYNCTVFAYGQTGTGKTFTMEGQSNDPAIHWQIETPAGIIPRCLSHLFDELRVQGFQEYTVKVSYLELYNEELLDLLSTNDDTSSKIRIFEDTSKKGSVIIHGLEEVIVHNKNAVYKILEKGSEKRQTAATLMNAHSSRSHTVFTITVHMKEVTPEGDELIKTGKLNLVDLAGSENIGRSGAIDRRAREAGNINQSLLTLGRVITALVERAPHIPYRESKLTRLLQDSLGGRTKTSIIATISPSSINLDETLSTLDYAHRAKNITNRPELNQKLTKTALIREYTAEIERLKRELMAARDKNGVYLDPEDYGQMQASLEFQGKEIEEKLLHIKALEDTMAAKEKIFDQLQVNLESTKHEVQLISRECDEQKFLVDNLSNVKDQLTKQAEALLSVTNIVTGDKEKLHEKVEQQYQLVNENKMKAESFNVEIQGDIHHVSKHLDSFKHKMNKSTKNFQDVIDDSVQFITKEVTKELDAMVSEVRESSMKIHAKHLEWFNQQLQKADFYNQSLNNDVRRITDEFHKRVSNDCDNMALNLEDFKNRMIERHQFIKQALKPVQDYHQKIIDNLKFENLKQIQDKNIKVRTDLAIERKEMKDLANCFMTKYQEIDAKMAQVDDDLIKDSENAIVELEKMEAIASEVTQVKKYIEEDLMDAIDDTNTFVVSEITKSSSVVNKTRINSTDLETELNEMVVKADSYNNDVSVSTCSHIDALNLDYQIAMSRLDNVVNNMQNSDVGEGENELTHVQRLIKMFDNTQNKLNHLGNCITDYRQLSETEINDCKDEFTNIGDKLQKFLSHELKRAEPTGRTPARKEFNYPRSIIKMSPKERILQRYRILREQMDSETNGEINLDENGSLSGASSVSSLKSLSGVDNTGISRTSSNLIGDDIVTNIKTVLPLSQSTSALNEIPKNPVGNGVFNSMLPLKHSSSCTEMISNKENNGENNKENNDRLKESNKDVYQGNNNKKSFLAIPVTRSISKMRPSNNNNVNGKRVLSPQND